MSALRTAALLAARGGSLQTLGANLGGYIAGGPAAAGRIAAVPLIANHRLAVLELPGGRLLAQVPTGIALFGVVLDKEGATAWVSNWGGRVPSEKDLTAPTGLAPDADRVVVDPRGIAASGTLTRIDLTAMRATDTVAVGLHSTAMAWDQQRERLYVANGNEDSISVVGTRGRRLLRSFPLQPFRQPVKGVAPTALALSPDGQRLWVACGGINAIAVMDAASGKIEGLIFTAWYPNHVAVSPDGRYLAVSNLLGVGSGWRDEPRKQFVHACRGSVAVIALPDAAHLAGYTTAVAENNRLAVGSPAVGARAAAAHKTPVAVPLGAGDPSHIVHVVYIIKENRTYDQVFGDLERGNGDPSLVMFGWDVTPNQHRLAEQFVLLDNFYATGGNSGDGHQWLTQANQTDYCMRPGCTGRSYPFDGTGPIAYSQGGFLRDAARKAGKRVRVFGEYAGRLNETSNRQRAELLERWRKADDFPREWRIRAPLEPLNAVLAHNYPSYSTATPDVVRARIFLAHLKDWVAEGRMPNLVVVQLPSHQARGTAPGASTPKAMVADNDLALGQIVEAPTRTPLWRRVAIFVVEDNAQNGVDHVDGHRTVALVVSPYARRGWVDSTFYSRTSMVKTIELILGLPAPSLFDLIATFMHASFTNEPDCAGYSAVTPRPSLFEVNPPLAALRGAARQTACDSMKMRFDVPDAAPTETLNRILWHNVRGFHVPYPGVRRAAFAPLSPDLDDDQQ